MKKLETYLMTMGIVLSSLVLTGCGSTPKPAPKPVQTPVAARPVAQSAYKQVLLGDIPFGQKRKLVEDEKDLRQVVEVAFATADMGDHKLAAKMFSQALKDFSSQDKKLERSLISAAICEYFQAGMIEEVREYLKMLDTYRTSVYKDFDDNDTIAKIRKIVK